VEVNAFYSTIQIMSILCRLIGIGWNSHEKIIEKNENEKNFKNEKNGKNEKLDLNGINGVNRRGVEVVQGSVTFGVLLSGLALGIERDLVNIYIHKYVYYI
jgi:hypothetical protein